MGSRLAIANVQLNQFIAIKSMQCLIIRARQCFHDLFLKVQIPRTDLRFYVESTVFAPLDKYRVCDN